MIPAISPAIVAQKTLKVPRIPLLRKNAEIATKILDMNKPILKAEWILCSSFALTKNVHIMLAIIPVAANASGKYNPFNPVNAIAPKAIAAIMLPT